MFAVGLWGAQMGGRPVWTLPVTFRLIMVIGGIAGMVGIPLPGIEIGIAISILALGMAIALAAHSYSVNSIYLRLIRNKLPFRRF
jgi:urease accessory protein